MIGSVSSQGSRMTGTHESAGTPGPAERVRVGVVLPRPGDLGEWLSEAVAFEAAGADALWLDHGAEPPLDPLILTAALAAVTYRALLVAAVPETAGSRALATAERLSRGRLALIIAEDAGAGGDEEVQRLTGQGAVSCTHL
ncbi:LLM class flavin-dependent oxidoreductase, partial [Nonomuraea zeae]